MSVRCRIAIGSALAALMIVSVAALPAAVQAAPDADLGVSGRGSPKQDKPDKPSAKGPDRSNGDETRGVIDDTPSFCDVTPPCPKGCVKDAVRDACVEVRGTSK